MEGKSCNQRNVILRIHAQNLCISGLAMPPRRTRAANVAAKTTEEASTEEANEVDISVEGMTEKGTMVK